MQTFLHLSVTTTLRGVRQWRARRGRGARHIRAPPPSALRLVPASRSRRVERLRYRASHLQRRHLFMARPRASGCLVLCLNPTTTNVSAFTRAMGGDQDLARADRPCVAILRQEPTRRSVSETAPSRRLRIFGGQPRVRRGFGHVPS